MKICNRFAKAAIVSFVIFLLLPVLPGCGRADGPIEAEVANYEPDNSRGGNLPPAIVQDDRLQESYLPDNGRQVAAPTMYEERCLTTFIETPQAVNNPFFFPAGASFIEFEGMFVPNSGVLAIFQTAYLNVRRLKEFENAHLYVIYVNQLSLDYVEHLANICPDDPWLAFYRMNPNWLHLGFFYVTDDVIYRTRAAAYTGSGLEEFIERQNVKILADFEVYGMAARDWHIAANNDGTEDIPIYGDWHRFVEVEGSQRIFRQFSGREGGTTMYERIVWEEGRGIVFYLSGVGAMREHIEFWERDR